MRRHAHVDFQLFLPKSSGIPAVSCPVLYKRQQKAPLFGIDLERIRVYKIQWQEKIRNEDLWERAGQEPVAKQILRRKWGWIGHTLRKPASSTTHQALTRNPQGKRKRGRPRNSWRRDTEAELKQQGTNWTGMVRAVQSAMARLVGCLLA